MEDLCCGRIIDVHQFLLAEVYRRYQNTSLVSICKWIRFMVNQQPNQPGVILNQDDEKLIEQNLVRFVRKLEKEDLWPGDLPPKDFVFVGLRIPQSDWSNWDNMAEMKKKIYESVKVKFRMYGLYKEGMTDKEKADAKPLFYRGADIDHELQFVRE